MPGPYPREFREDVVAVARSRESGVTILFVEHNLDAVHRLADRVFAMTLGSKIAEGTAAEVVADPRVVRAYLGDEAADAA